MQTARFGRTIILRRRGGGAKRLPNIEKLVYFCCFVHFGYFYCKIILCYSGIVLISENNGCRCKETKTTIFVQNERDGER